MSPVATVSNEEATRAILTAADELFYAKGIKAVTMSEVRDVAGVSMRRLYNVYPNKSDLVTGWLRDRHERWTCSFTDGVEQRVAAGALPLEAVFAQLEDWMVSTKFRGCAFINTHAEFSDSTIEQLGIVRNHKRALEVYLANLVPDLPGLAVLIDGAIVQASIHSSTDPIRAALQLARRGSQQ